MLKHNVSRVLFVSMLAFGAYCSPAAEETAEKTGASALPQEPVTAAAELQPTAGNAVAGSVSFEESNGRVKIVAHVTGLEPGKHGFHIHETGDCSAPDGTSAGGHFNPDQSAHGAPDADTHHAGDLGNIEADAQGVADLDMSVEFVTLTEGAHSILGRAVIVHAQEDDFGQPTGHAGARLACGVIR
ncbi:MAG: superoxide dismutase family protein [Acidobacteriota bacterium]